MDTTDRKACTGESSPPGLCELNHPPDHYISTEGKCIRETDNLTLESESNLIDIDMATLPQIYLDEK